MDMQVRRSSLGLRSALGLVTAVSVALPALILFATTIGTYQRYYPPEVPPGYHMLDGPTYDPLTGSEIGWTVFGVLLLSAVIVSALGLWSRFRRFAPILAVATTTFAAWAGEDTVLCAMQQGSSCEQLFHLNWTWVFICGWACFVALVLRQISRGQWARADRAASSTA